MWGSNSIASQDYVDLKGKILDYIYNVTLSFLVTIYETIVHIILQSADESTYYFSGFVVLGTIAIVFTVLVVIAADFTGVRAAKYLHSTMLENVIYSPMK